MYFRITYQELRDRLAQLLARNGYDQRPCYEGPDECKNLDVFKLPKALASAREV